MEPMATHDLRTMLVFLGFDMKAAVATEDLCAWPEALWNIWVLHLGSQAAMSEKFHPGGP